MQNAVTSNNPTNQSKEQLNVQSALERVLEICPPALIEMGKVTNQEDWSKMSFSTRKQMIVDAGIDYAMYVRNKAMELGLDPNIPVDFIPEDPVPSAIQQGFSMQEDTQENILDGLQNDFADTNLQSQVPEAVLPQVEEATQDDKISPQVEAQPIQPLTVEDVSTDDQAIGIPKQETQISSIQQEDLKQGTTDVDTTASMAQPILETPQESVVPEVLKVEELQTAIPQAETIQPAMQSAETIAPEVISPETISPETIISEKSEQETAVPQTEMPIPELSAEDKARIAEETASASNVKQAPKFFGYQPSSQTVANTDDISAKGDVSDSKTWLATLIKKIWLSFTD